MIAVRDAVIKLASLADACGVFIFSHGVAPAKTDSKHHGIETAHKNRDGERK